MLQVWKTYFRLSHTCEYMKINQLTSPRLSKSLWVMRDLHTDISLSFFWALGVVWNPQKNLTPAIPCILQETWKASKSSNEWGVIVGRQFTEILLILCIDNVRLLAVGAPSRLEVNMRLTIGSLTDYFTQITQHALWTDFSENTESL